MAVDPKTKLEIAFATDPFATPTWTDVSDYLIEYHVKRGRQHELGRTEAGTLVCLLDNQDRRFEPDYSGSPYSPNVLPMRKVRLRVGENLVTNPSIETDTSGWTSGFIYVNPSTLTRVSTEAKVGSWSLKVDTDGVQAFDGAEHTALPITSGQAYVASAWVKGPSGKQLQLGFGNQNGSSAGTTLFTCNGSWQRVSVSWTANATGNVGDLFVRQVAPDAFTFYIDGAQIVAGTETQPYVDKTYDVFTGFVERWPVSWELPNYSEVPITAVDGFEFLAQADIDGSFSQQLSGARIGAVLDQIGWAAGDRSIDAGQSQIQAQTFELGAAQGALAHLQDAADTELGILFMSGDGKVVFHDRHKRLKSPYTTSQGTFGDADGELPYERLIPSFDKDRIANDYHVTRVGGTRQSSSDTTSKNKYGKRTQTRSPLLTTDIEAADMANFLVSRYKDPALRFDSMTIAPLEDGNLLNHALGRELGDHITVKRRPPGGGAVKTKEVHIEGIDLSGKAGADMSLTWQLSPVDENQYWVLGDAQNSLLGQTTRLAY